jgi:hypothetical protein
MVSGGNRAVIASEIAGIVFIVFSGAALHFLFAWSGYWPPAAVVAGVNESTWEHFKIGFWPMLLWALIEYPFLRKHTNNYVVAKCAALLTLPLVIAALFYAYTAITGHHFLIADIVIFIIAIIAGQTISYKLLTANEIGKVWLKGLALALVAAMILAYSLLSYYPPRSFLFEHPETGEYGILESYEDHDHSDEHDHHD